MIKLDTKGLERDLVRIVGNVRKDLDTRRLTSDISAFVAGRIKTRTLSGKDKFNSSFAPYTKGTKAQRKRKGRQTARVDLFDSGQMQAAIGTEQISDTEARVGFFDAIQRKKALLHNFGGRVTRNRIFGKFITSYTVDYPRRAFFGTSDEDQTTVDGINMLIKEAEERAVKGARNG